MCYSLHRQVESRYGLHRVTATMTTMATMAAITLPHSVGIAVAIALIILLAAKELASAYGGPRLKLLGRYIVIPIIPLLLLFAVIVVTEIIQATK